MTVLSEDVLFDGAGIPLRVRDQTARSPSGPVAAEAVMVMFAISGWARVDSPAESAPLEPGTVLAIPAGMECADYPHGHARTVTFYLHPEYLAAELRWLSLEHPLVHQLHRSVQDIDELGRLQLPHQALHHLAPRLVRLAHLEPGGGNEFTMLSLASEVADLVGRAGGAAKIAPQPMYPARQIPRPEITAAVALLRQRLDHSWGVDELARRVALSRSQLSRLFQDQIGLSPAAYLPQVRADRMAELLATRRLGVGEAAQAAGWMNPVVASRAFERRYGVSPRAFAATDTVATVRR